MYLITGVAGFIGMHFAKKMLDKGYKVLGVDNLNDYYDTKLKKNRVLILKKYKNFKFLKSDLKSLNTYRQINKSKITHIVHLAGQAGVRYSIKNPGAYVNDNIMAYVNLLEAFKYSKKLKCIVYASSSSVYGKSREHFSKNYLLQPISMYAATKMSMELISNVYLDLYKMKSIGVRFFTKDSLSTSKILSVTIIFNFFFTLSGISSKSFLLSLGIITFLIPDLKAANNFSFKPPIGKTLPLNVISPVIATL